MDRAKLKEKVIKLRKQGKTYSEIKNSLRKIIPESTLSYWCKGVPLPLKYYKKIKILNEINREKGRKIALEINKRNREKYLSEIKRRNLVLFKNVNLKAMKLALAMLYLGEGGKWKSHPGLVLGSSDPNIIILYLKLLNKCYHLKPQDLKCRISYRADQDIDNLQRFWSRVAKIPLKNFYKTKPDPRTIGKKTLKKDYKGVCVISGGGAEIQLELEIIPKLIFLGP
ncbi:MAG: hypothetical protein ABH876_02310 [Patescibacteria group bacterium]|nr:hypothetical protein [Patescibacteria group bacterium]MBU1877180.1 hypothetical protein [Patescibacteria group bacterium]